MRKSLIESHLEKINSDMAEEILITSWESHVGVACRGVNWDRHSLSELRAAVTCIGGPCLASICRHLAQDYRSWSSGMPDLLLWRFHEDYKGEAKLVEVKGPRDRLSEQQRAWLLLLMDYGFNVEVCKVGPASKWRHVLQINFIANSLRNREQWVYSEVVEVCQYHSTLSTLKKKPGQVAADDRNSLGCKPCSPSASWKFKFLSEALLVVMDANLVCKLFVWSHMKGLMCYCRGNFSSKGRLDHIFPTLLYYIFFVKKTSPLYG